MDTYEESQYWVADVEKSSAVNSYDLSWGKFIGGLLSTLRSSSSIITGYISKSIRDESLCLNLDIKIPKIINTQENAVRVVDIKNMEVRFMQGRKTIKKLSELINNDDDFPLYNNHKARMHQEEVKVAVGEFWSSEINKIGITLVLKLETGKNIVEEPKPTPANPEYNFGFNLFEFRDLFCDVEINCGGQEFKSHKLVLAVISPVLKKMFESGLKEEQEGRIVIEEMEPTILKLLLDGIYSGKISSADVQDFKDLVNLFKVAHRYCIDSLRDWTEAQICEKINAENALDVLSLSEVYENRELRINALALVKKEKAKIFHDPSVLQQFLDKNQENSKLIQELILMNI